MKTNRIVQPSFLEDLAVTPPTFGVAILNKERFLDTLRDSDTITDLSLLKNIKSEFLTYRGALL